MSQSGWIAKSDEADLPRGGRCLPWHLSAATRRFASGELSAKPSAIWSLYNSVTPFREDATGRFHGSLVITAQRLREFWAYCHVPAGSTVDMTAEIEQQIERFAPGFGDCILARTPTTTATLEQGNANCIGGDISGGVMDLWQLFTRPTPRLVP